MSEPRNFARIDFTQEECDAMAQLAEFFQAQRGAFVLYLKKHQVTGMTTNYEIDRLASVINGVRQKCSIAASVIKPEIVLS